MFHTFKNHSQQKLSKREPRRSGKSLLLEKTPSKSINCAQCKQQRNWRKEILHLLACRALDLFYRMMSLHLENSRQITKGVQGKNSLIYHSTDALHGQQWVAILEMFEVHIDAWISDGYLFPLFVCMCVCVHVYAYIMCSCMFACEWAWYVEDRGQCQGSSFIAIHLIFLRDDCSPTLELIHCLNQLASVF